jgi:hypothetical protein
MCLNSILLFFRKFPALDALFLFIMWFLMSWMWHRAAHDPKEKDTEKRQAGAAAITNQINGTLTAASIVLAGVGAVLAVGYTKNFPGAALNHLTYAAIEALISIVIGVYTLGYIPSVLHIMDVTKKPAVQLACFLQLMMIIVSIIRLLFALLYLSGTFPLC